MKNRLLIVVTSMILIVTLLVGSDLYSRHLIGTGFLYSGYSPLDLLFLFGIVIVILALGSFLLSGRLRELLTRQLGRILEDKNWLAGILIILCLITYEAFRDYLFLRAEIPDVHYQQYRQLLMDYFSLLGLVFLGCFQLLLLVITLQWKTVKSWIKRLFQARWVTIFLGLILLFSLLNFSGYGFIFGEEVAAWAQTMNAPLPGIQVILLAGFLLLGWWVFTLIIRKWPNVKSIFYAEFVISLGLWLLAIVLWSNTPLGANYYIDIPRAPNYELYPSSDQLKYDIQALDLLAGGGMRPNVLHPTADYIQHPMHSLYLAILHGISGEGYEDVLFLQVAILGFIPVLLYKLGSLIHTRFSGLVVGLLYLIRERNALFLGEHITVSNVKTLMTEPLALLGLLLFLYLLLLWMKSDNQKLWLILLVGGAFGFLVLIRIEVLAMIPVIGLMTLLYLRRQWKTWLLGVGAAGIAILMVITPWMIRNYRVEGRLELDKSFYIQWIINNYKDYLFPEEKPQEDTRLIPIDNSPKLYSSGGNSLNAVISPGISKSRKMQSDSPTEYFWDHFVNNIQQTIYYLPSNHQPLFTVGSLRFLLPGAAADADLEGDRFSEKYLERYVKGLPYWGLDWDGKLVPRSYLPLVVTIGLISIGLSQVRRDRLWITILLALMILTQSAVYALLSGSGGRNIAIVDWIPRLYYGIGFSILVTKGFELISGSKLLISADDFSSGVREGTKVGRVKYCMLAFAGVVCAGLVLPLSEVLLPSPYTESALETQLGLLSKDIGFEYPVDETKGQVILYGKALYPRFYKAGDRMDDDRKGTIPDYSFKRVEFYLVGTQNAWIALPLRDEVEFFPHGSEVIILADLEIQERSPEGQMVHGNYFKASLIYILNANQINSYPVALPCSGNYCNLDVD